MVKSPLRWPGGKSRVASQIVAHFPRDIKEYREPFLGGGSVFLLAKQLGLAHRYVVSDINAELICFWRQAKKTIANEELRDRLHQMRSLSTAMKKSMHRHYRENERGAGAPSTPMEHAVRFFFMNRVSFSGTTRAGGFSEAAAETRFTKSSIERLAALPDVLRETEFSYNHYDNQLTHDRNVFFYLDPPYFSVKSLYWFDGQLVNFDHERFATQLHQVKSRWLLSYDNCPEVRDMYGDFNIFELGWKYGMTNCGKDKQSKDGKELLICNYTDFRGDS